MSAALSDMSSVDLGTPSTLGANSAAAVLFAPLPVDVLN